MTVVNQRLHKNFLNPQLMQIKLWKNFFITATLCYYSKSFTNTPLFPGSHLQHLHKTCFTIYYYRDPAAASFMALPAFIFTLHQKNFHSLFWLQLHVLLSTQNPQLFYPSYCTTPSVKKNTSILQKCQVIPEIKETCSRTFPSVVR